MRGVDGKLRRKYIKVSAQKGLIFILDVYARGTATQRGFEKCVAITNGL